MPRRAAAADQPHDLLDDRRRELEEPVGRGGARDRAGGPGDDVLHVHGERRRRAVDGEAAAHFAVVGDHPVRRRRLPRVADELLGEQEAELLALDEDAAACGVERAAEIGDQHVGDAPARGAVLGAARHGEVLNPHGRVLHVDERGVCPRTPALSHRDRHGLPLALANRDPARRAVDARLATQRRGGGEHPVAPRRHPKAVPVRADLGDVDDHQGLGVHGADRGEPLARLRQLRARDPPGECRGARGSGGDRKADDDGEHAEPDGHGSPGFPLPSDAGRARGGEERGEPNGDGSTLHPLSRLQAPATTPT